MYGPLIKHCGEKGGARRQTTLDSFVLKTFSSPKNERVAKVVDKWKIKQINPGSVKVDPKSIRMPKSRGGSRGRGKKRGGKK
jgi:hypothetical protein